MANIKLDILGMANGQDAGICQYDGGKAFSSLGVVMKNNEKRFIGKTKEYKKDASENFGMAIPKRVKTIYLRVKADFNGVCNFEYSFDNKKYSAFGGSSQLSWAWFRGARFSIYNHNNLQEAAFVDVDWFRYPIENK